MLKINQNIVDDLVEKIESRNNKVSSWSPTTTDAHYPSEKLVKNSLDGKANISHIHSISNVTSLQDELDDKSDVGHTHDTDEILEESALPHLELNANANQHAINLAIDSKIGAGGSGGTAIACVSDFSLDQSDIDNIKLYVDVCQGKVIDRISKSSQGLVDTYTIYFDNNDTYVFTVTNGRDATITIDNSISSTSENAVMNKVIYSALQNKANSTHTHSISDVTGLQSALNGKSDTNHTHSEYVNPTIVDNLTTNDATKVLSAKQGYQLNQMIGNAITYINQ